MPVVVFKTGLLVTLFSICAILASAHRCRDAPETVPSSRYAIPKPQFQVFKSGGFRISIPDHPGIEIFAFHGNINKPIHGLAAGQFSKDITRVQGNTWVFEDYDVKLHIGDKIYYWLFVIKDSLGYRLDNGYYKVTEFIDKDSVDDGQLFDDEINTSGVTGKDKKTGTNEGGPGETQTPLPPSQQPSTVDANLRICEKTVLNLTHTLLGLQSQIDSLRDENNILRDIIERQEGVSRKLLLDGRIPFNDDPVVTVRDFVRQKLDLPIIVSEAVRNKNGSISFNVATLNDKITIVKAAGKKLQNSKLIIVY